MSRRQTTPWASSRHGKDCPRRRFFWVASACLASSTIMLPLSVEAAFQSSPRSGPSFVSCTGNRWVAAGSASSTTAVFQESATNVDHDETTNTLKDDKEFIPAVNYDNDPSMIDLKKEENPGDLFLSQLAGTSEAADFVFDPNPSNVPDFLSRLKQWAGEYDKSLIQGKLEAWIQEADVFVLIFETCPYCKQVMDVSSKKASIVDQKLSMKVVDLDSLPTEEVYAMRVELHAITGRTGAPAVWIKGEYVGGCDDGGLGGIIPLEENGDLDLLLQP